MAKAPKMVRLSVDETSGVDHPAHLSEGWLVMKSASSEEINDVINSLTEVQSLTKEDSVSDETTVVTEDPAVVDAPAADAPTESPAEDKDARIAELEAELEKAKSKMTADEKEEADEAQKPGESDADYAMRMKTMKKMAEMEDFAKAAVAKAVAVEKARADEATALLAKEREARADELAIAKAKDWNNLPLEAEKVGPALRRLAIIDEALAKSIEGILTSVNAQAKTSNLFAEIGKSVGSDSVDAYDRMTALAKAAVDSGVASSMEQALADVALSNQDLYKQYLSEKAGK
jgi:hypothetical protein